MFTGSYYPTASHMTLMSLLIIWHQNPHDITTFPLIRGEMEYDEIQTGNPSENKMAVLACGVWWLHPFPLCRTHTHHGKGKGVTTTGHTFLEEKVRLVYGNLCKSYVKWFINPWLMSHSCEWLINDLHWHKNIKNQNWIMTGIKW